MQDLLSQWQRVDSAWNDFMSYQPVTTDDLSRLEASLQRASDVRGERLPAEDWLSSWRSSCRSTTWWTSAVPVESALCVQALSLYVAARR